VNELLALAEYLGIPVKDNDVEATLASMDTDGSGKLEKSEFLDWWVEVRLEYTYTCTYM
jgi:Ca2+-binding EF-hand superfamily protein